MADKLLISISAEQATVARLRRGKLSSCHVFAASPTGRTEFDSFLAELKNVPVLVMVDAVEEEYRFEALPHAVGADRSELVGRRLKQLFRNSPYCSASLQGRDTGKRRDDLYLFFALTNPDLIEDWLKIVRAHNLPVAGVHLLPLVMHAAIERLAVRATNLLLVTKHHSGLRLTFFREKQLRISRLTRADTSEERTETVAYTEEVANTRLYLHALRIMTLDEPLAVVLLDRDGTLAGLAASIARDASNAQVARLGPGDLAARLGMTEELLQSAPDALYLHLLGARQPRGNLAPAPVTATFQQYQVRRGLYGLAGATAVITLCWSALNAYQIFTLQQEQTQAAARTVQFQHQYEEVRRKFPDTPTSPDNLIRAVETAERIQKGMRNPEHAMSVVGRALEEFPQVVLKSFGWRYGVRGFDTESAEGRKPEGTPDAARPASGQGTPPVTGSARRQSAYIDAEINPFQGDFRKAIGEIEALAALLRSQPGVADVQITALPLNVSPATALSGSTADTGRTSTSAPFRMVIAFRQDA